MQNRKKNVKVIDQTKGNEKIESEVERQNKKEISKQKLRRRL